MRWSLNEGPNYIKCTTMGTENEDPLTQTFAQYKWSFKAGLTDYPYSIMVSF